MTNLLFAILLLFTSTVYAVEYTGNNIVTILGKSPASEDFSQFKTYWVLDSKLQNTNNGIKVYTDNKGVRVDTVLLSGYGYTQSGVSFRTCSSALPYGIVLTDNVESIKGKVKSGMMKHGDDYYFNAPGVVVRVRYQSYGRIQALRVYNGELPVLIEPLKTTTTTTTASTTNTKTNTSTAVVARTAPAVSTSTNHIALHKAVMQVFNSWKESSFSSLKGSERQAGNFWDYKYTYASRVKIPGEKFSMVYSFPFVTSSLDYVSVLKEGDTYDSSFETVYKQYEKDLGMGLRKEEGWSGRCLPNTDGSKLSDVEYKHPLYGSVVLDYCRHPKGKHVLYLRFVPFG